MDLRSPNMLGSCGDRKEEENKSIHNMAHYGVLPIYLINTGKDYSFLRNDGKTMHKTYSNMIPAGKDFRFNSEL